MLSLGLSSPVQSNPPLYPEGFVRHFHTAPPQQKIKQQYQHAANLMRNGHTNQSIDTLKALLQHDNDYLPAHHLLIALLIEQQDYLQATQWLDNSEKRFPEKWSLRHLRARLLMMENKTEQALTHLQYRPPRLESAPDYYGLMATLQQKLGYPDQALPLYQQLLLLQPQQGRWWVGLATSSESLEDYKSAFKAYQKALESPVLPIILRHFCQQRLQTLQDYN
jgi:MSHA biogenesis protein MshN